MPVYFHAIIRRRGLGTGANQMGSIAIYRDTGLDDKTEGIAEPIVRINLAPDQDPEVLMSMRGWDTCGEARKRASMIVVPVQPAEWSKSAS